MRAARPRLRWRRKAGLASETGTRPGWIRCRRVAEAARPNPWPSEPDFGRLLPPVATMTFAPRCVPPARDHEPSGGSDRLDAPRMDELDARARGRVEQRIEHRAAPVGDGEELAGLLALERP